MSVCRRELRGDALCAEVIEERVRAGGVTRSYVYQVELVALWEAMLRMSENTTLYM